MVTTYFQETKTMQYEEKNTVEEMIAACVVANEGKFFKYTGTTNGKYINGDYYEVVNV